MRYLITGALLLVLSSQGHFTMEDVQKKFAGINRFEVLIDQTKTSTLLSQPLQSQVRMTLKDNAVTWKVLRPVATEITMDNHGLRTGGKAVMPQSTSGERKIQAVIRMITAMIKADADALKADFSLSWTPLVLVAIPRKGSELEFFRQLKIVFNEKLEPVSFEYVTDQESSEMRFSELIYRREPGTEP